MYTVKFADSLHRKPVEFKNMRTFQFTRSRSKIGKANFSLDISPASKRIRAGWLVEIWRDGKKVYWGQVVKRQKKKGKYKIFAHDAAGFLSRRLLTQRPVVNQEASLEIKEKFDGLVLVGDYVLSADKFLEKTSTSNYWHWEKNPMLDYLRDICEKVDNISGDSANFFFWITPDLDLHVGQEGSFGYYKDLKLTNITVSEDIEQTYNKVTVEGLPVLKIPYDGDAWTESVVGFTQEVQDTLNNFSSQLVDDPVKIGKKSLRLEADYQGGYATSGALEWTQWKASRRLNTGDRYIFNGENATIIHVWYNHDIDSVYDNYFELKLELVDSANKKRTWVINDASADVKDTWYEVNQNVNSGYTEDSGFDITTVSFVSFIIYTSSPTSLVNGKYSFFIDEFYIATLPYSYTAEDTQSQSLYGVLEKEFIARDFYSNAECQTMANTLLGHYKNAKLVINASIDGFIDLMPNSTLRFVDEEDGTVYEKALASITYYVNADGSEAAQLTLGDFKKTDVEVILEKLAEINRNYNLLENPYVFL